VRVETSRFDFKPLEKVDVVVVDPANHIHQIDRHNVISTTVHYMNRIRYVLDDWLFIIG